MKTRMDVKKRIVWFVPREKRKGGREFAEGFARGAGLISVRGSTCISPRKKTVGTFSIPGNFRTLSDLITASLAKCSIFGSLPGSVVLAYVVLKQN